MAGSLYFWEMLLPALGLCLPLNRREKSLWKAVTCMITGVVLLTVIMKLAQTKYEGTLISMGENIMFSMMMLGWFLVIWSLVIGCIYFCIKLWCGAYFLLHQASDRMADRRAHWQY